MMLEPTEISEPTEKTNIDWMLTASIELEDDSATELLSQMGNNIPDKFSISMVKLIQAKKHKKKRINKKWLKRYGYKEVYINSDGWKCDVNNDLYVEFTKHITKDEYETLAKE